MKTYYSRSLFTMAFVMLLPGFFVEPVAAPSQNKPDSNNSVFPCSRVFSIYDIDRNGALSRDEYRQFVAQIEIRRKSTGRPMRRYSPTLRFEEIDSNNDEYLSEDEMISALNKRLQKHRRYRYKNGRS